MNYIPIWHKIKIDKPLAACYVTEIGFIALSYKTKYVNIPNDMYPMYILKLTKFYVVDC